MEHLQPQVTTIKKTLEKLAPPLGTNPFEEAAREKLPPSQGSKEAICEAYKLIEKGGMQAINAALQELFKIENKKDEGKQPTTEPRQRVPQTWLTVAVRLKAALKDRGDPN